jgi:hypothetical protein
MKDRELGPQFLTGGGPSGYREGKFESMVRTCDFVASQLRHSMRIIRSVDL